METTAARRYGPMLKEMTPDERPRGRLKLRGLRALSAGDLLAIIVNTGVIGTRRRRAGGAATDQ